MPTFQFAAQFLEMIAGRYTKVGVARCIIHHLKLSKDTVPWYKCPFYEPPFSRATRSMMRWMKTTLKLIWLARSGTNSVTKLPIGAVIQPLAIRSAPGPHPILWYGT